MKEKQRLNLAEDQIIMGTAIVTDSNSGIFEAEGRRLGVFVVPMPVQLQGKTYYEGRNITHEEFFCRLAGHEQIFTSQPAPSDILDLWDKLLETHNDLVYIPMSSSLSGSCQTAQGLAREYGGRVQVVDNHRISVTQRHSVLDALALRKQGHSACQIREILEKRAYDSLIYVGVSTLEYLKASGRVTPAAAALGTVLNIKPLLVIQGERLDAYAKPRGTKNCQRRLIEAMREYADRLRGNGEKLRIGAAGSFREPKESACWEAMVKEAFPKDTVRCDPLTLSIACHVGPDAFGMGISSFVVKE